MQVMTINGTRFPLSPVQDLATLRDSLAVAVQVGGSFVDFTTRSLAQVSFLVTPQSSIHLAEEPEVEARPSVEDANMRDLEAWAWGDAYWEHP